jgi:hypothetical protein
VRPRSCCSIPFEWQTRTAPRLDLPSSVADETVDGLGAFTRPSSRARKAEIRSHAMARGPRSQLSRRGRGTRRNESERRGPSTAPPHKNHPLARARAREQRASPLRATHSSMTSPVFRGHLLKGICPLASTCANLEPIGVIGGTGVPPKSALVARVPPGAPASHPLTHLSNCVPVRKIQRACAGA